MLINKTVYLELFKCLQLLNELTSQPKDRCYKESGITTQFVPFTWEGHPLEPMPVCMLAGSLWRAVLSLALWGRVSTFLELKGAHRSKEIGLTLRKLDWEEMATETSGEGMPSFTAAADPCAPESRPPPAASLAWEPLCAFRVAARFSALFHRGVKTFVLLWHCFKSVFEDTNISNHNVVLLID